MQAKICLTQELEFFSKAGKRTLVSSHKGENPAPAYDIAFPLVANITWLFQNITTSGDKYHPSFSVDRNSKTCYTPRRNDDINTALDTLQSVLIWANNVSEFLSRILCLPSYSEPPLDLMSFVRTNEIFLPVLPITCARKQSFSETKNSSKFWYAFAQRRSYFQLAFIHTTMR